MKKIKSKAKKVTKTQVDLESFPKLPKLPNPMQKIITT
jgi:hypothetical protein